MMEALKPIFAGWPAQLAQVAAHAKTLKQMLSQSDLQSAALEDVRALRAKLSRCEGIALILSAAASAI